VREHRGQIEDEPSEVPDWFNKTRQQLFESWRARTGHDAQCDPRRWACEISSRCQRGGQHLSIPCSVGLDADELALLLKPGGYADHPVIYIRLYLMMLYEFTDTLHTLGKRLKFDLPDRPDRLKIWANCFAKHRALFQLQHHPGYAFADMYGPAAKQFFAVVHAKHFIDGCNNRRPLSIIDYRWFRNEERKQDGAVTNGPAQAIILVPPLEDFLSMTMDYFRKFVDACLRNQQSIQEYESMHFRSECV
jgi:hypothetical protein